MGLRISTNVAALRTGRQLEETNETHSRTLERLSSGDRIVHSADDAASLSISEKLKGSIRSYQAAQRNSQDGISLIQTAEGGIVEAQNILIRLRELSVQAASDTVGDAERRFTNREFQQLKGEIQRIANTTLYDGQHLLNGSGPSVDVQVGVDAGGVNQLSFASSVSNILPSTIGISDLAIDTKEGALAGLPNIDSAIGTLGKNRAYLGGLQSELHSHIQNMDIHRTNLTDTNSRLRDTDVAYWSAQSATEGIKQQAGTAMLAQANGLGKAAVSLLEKA